MKHLFKTLVAIIVVIGICSCEKDRNTISITGDSSDIGASSAKLYGWCNQKDTEGASVVYGIELSDTDLTTDAWSLTAEGRDAKNKYCCQATGLKSNTTYYYRSFCLNNGVTTYGEIKKFKTLDFTATVTTLDATDITEFRATLTGSVSVSVPDALVHARECWFLISPTATDLESLKSSGVRYNSWMMAEDGTFNAETIYLGGKSRLSPGLNDNTLYYYVAASHANNTDIYGEVKTFTTLPININVETLDMEITERSRILKGVYFWHSSEDGIIAPECGFLISKTASTLEDLKASGEKIYGGTPFMSNIFSKEITDPYISFSYYVAWCKLRGKSFFGEVKFTATP